MALFDTLVEILTPYADGINDLLSRASTLETGLAAVNSSNYMVVNANSYGVLPENADLNNYTEPGVWRVPNATRAQTLANLPTALAGFLIVVNSSTNVNCTQIYIEHTGASRAPYIFVRPYADSNKVFGPWKELTGAIDAKKFKGDVLCLTNGSEYLDTWTLGSYFDLSKETISSEPEASAQYGYQNIACSEGDQFLLVAIHTKSKARGWAFVDSNNNILSVDSATEKDINGLTITAPENAVRLISNNANTASYGAHIIKLNPQTNP